MLRFERIYKAYGAQRVLHGVSHHFGAGAFALRGPNGVGKSTLLAVLAGAVEADSGAIWIDGQPLHQLPVAAPYAPTLAQLVFGGWFVLCFWVGSGQLVQALTSNELTWDEPEWSDLRGVLAQLGIWIAIAFFGVARFLSYIDQRIRQEGWEVELRLREVGRSLEDSRRW